MNFHDSSAPTWLFMAALLAASLFATPAFAQVNCGILNDCEPPNPPPDEEPAVDGRLCRTDLLFLDVPRHVPIWWADTVPIDNIRAELEARANAFRGGWFCPGVIGPGGGCSEPLGVPFEVVVEVFSVFDPRGNSARADADLRFFRFRFWPAVNGAVPDNAEPLEVSPQAACDVVETLRALAQFELAIQQPGALRVGRECEATATQDVIPGQGDVGDDSAAGWHLERIGLEPNRDIERPTRGSPTAFVALIDGPVEAPVRAGIGIRQASDDPLIPLSRDAGGEPTSNHPHGSAMALLVRQVAPDARIVSFPVFDENNVAPLWAIGRAIDNAIFDDRINPRRPLVINLSVGFRPELIQPARLRGELSTVGGVPEFGALACDNYDDGAGEPVRYALQTAAELEESRDGADRGRERQQQRPSASITVVSAAGNFHTEQGTEPVDVVGELHPVGIATNYDPCTDFPRPDLSPPRTFPGQWGLESGCPSLTLTVSGTDSADGTSPLTRLAAETAVVAPGDQVTVWAGDSWAGDVDPAPGAVCAGDPAPPEDWRFYLPFSLSGSSVAAAQVSGAVARAHAVRGELLRARRELPAPRPPRLPALSRDAVTRLVYLTGERVRTLDDESCRRTAVFPAGIPIRRLAVDRLEQALRCEAADASSAAVSEALVKCLSLMPDRIGAEDADACRALVDLCVEEPVRSCPASRPEPTIPDPDEVNLCGDAAPALPPWTLCDGPGCGFFGLAGVTTLVGAGPQPQGGGCEDCRLYQQLAGGDLLLKGRFYGGKYTTWQSPRLAITWWDSSLGRRRTAERSLPDSAVVPGKSVSIGGINAPFAASDRSSASALLIIEEVSSSGQVSLLKEPLGPVGTL